MNRKRSKGTDISDIDRTLLSFCEKRWLKVARVIGKTRESFEKRKIKLSIAAIDARMWALVGNGRLEAQGNIRQWRYSEVRVPGDGTLVEKRSYTGAFLKPVLARVEAEEKD